MKKVQLLKVLREAKTNNEKLEILKTYSKECNLKMFTHITMKNLEEVYQTAINHLKPYDNGFCIEKWSKSVKEKGLSR